MLRITHQPLRFVAITGEEGRADAAAASSAAAAEGASCLLTSRCSKGLGLVRDTGALDPWWVLG